MHGWSRRADAASWTSVWPDLALAAALTAGGQVELHFAHTSGWHGLVHGMLLFAQTAPIALRRPYPTTVAGVCAVALAVEALATTPTNTTSGLFAGLVEIYTIGRWVAGWRLVAISVVSAAALALHIVRLPDQAMSDRLDNLAFAGILSAAAWLVGRTMRRRAMDRQRAAAEAQAQREAAAAEERSRIARELHDVVAHGMGVMVVQAAAAEQMLKSDPAAAQEPLSTVRRTGQEALAEMRRLLGLLRTGDAADAGEPQPGLDRLPALVEQLRGAGMPVTLTTTVVPVPLPGGLQLCVYRIAQEALTNCLKHASGAPTEMTLAYEPDALHLRIRNSPGSPAPEADTGAGHGLFGMSERVRVYGGTLAAQREADGGFLVDARLPLDSSSGR
ncbi:MAG: hypothetical protein BGO26_18600 [Actinobacteria bacterium 69-20]|nr:sensor histidine kinase [Actinomycetota bacterium]OJV24585.1 MAG: hypothetical protein BGO26_18600 [Actinobacteria bacterium 69-20]